jgi:MFS transporter, PAT family, beta-lactamase induction signal transducer AmpG
MNRTEAESAEERSTLSALGVFVERRTLVMLALGFSAGLPYFLVFDTLSAWLRAAGLSLEVIGFFSLVTMIHSFKFLWAPLVDRTEVPGLTAWLGHRRSWMLVCQALIMIGLWLVARSDPASNLASVAVFAVFVGFSSATQDIAIDAWRIEAADVARQGAMAAAYQWGYRVAVMVAGAAPLLLADAYGWNFSYAVMAVLMAVGIAGVAAAPREAPHAIHSIGRWAAVVDPLRDFFRRYGTSMWLILALICVYRIPDMFVLNMMNPFFLDLGFSLVEIAEVRKIFGVVMTSAGIFAGGFAVARYGVVRALVSGAFIAALSNLVFVWLATRGHDLVALFVAVGVENVGLGFTGTCLIAYMSGLTSAGFTATQYALLSSIYAIPSRLLASQSGRIVEGAANAAAAGGILAGLGGLFARLPPESFAGAVERSGVGPVALATGYVTLFASSSLIGLLPIMLALIVWRRQKGA